MQSFESARGHSINGSKLVRAQEFGQCHAQRDVNHIR